MQYSNLGGATSKSGQYGKDLGAGFDGRRLATFSRQRTGLKRIQDDLCGVYRDEHSRPFAVKTKSQINLHLFATNDPDDADETDNNGEEVTPVRTFVPRAIPMAMASAPPLPPQPSHSSPSKSIILPPPVSSSQLSPKTTNGANKTSSNFLAKLMNRSTTSNTNASIEKDDQERLVDEDQLYTTIVASSSLGLQSFSSTDIDPFDDDSSNFGESNALLSGSASAKPGIDTFQAKTQLTNSNANTRLTSRRRSGQQLTRDEQDDNDQDAPGAIRATYDFLNNW